MPQEPPVEERSAADAPGPPPASSVEDDSLSPDLDLWLKDACFKKDGGHELFEQLFGATAGEPGETSAPPRSSRVDRWYGWGNAGVGVFTVGISATLTVVSLFVPSLASHLPAAIVLLLLTRHLFDRFGVDFRRTRYYETRAAVIAVLKLALCAAVRLKRGADLPRIIDLLKKVYEQPPFPEPSSGSLWHGVGALAKRAPRFFK